MAGPRAHSAKQSALAQQRASPCLARPHTQLTKLYTSLVADTMRNCNWARAAQCLQGTSTNIPSMAQGHQVGTTAGRQAGRQAGRHAGRQAGRQAGRHAGRQAGSSPALDSLRQLGLLAPKHTLPHRLGRRGRNRSAALRVHHLRHTAGRSSLIVRGGTSATMLSPACCC
jgi:flagellar biosynthesis/type III secretory pathway protein FliH